MTSEDFRKLDELIAHLETLECAESPVEVWSAMNAIADSVKAIDQCDTPEAAPMPAEFWSFLGEAAAKRDPAAIAVIEQLCDTPLSLPLEGWTNEGPRHTTSEGLPEIKWKTLGSQDGLKGTVR